MQNEPGAAVMNFDKYAKYMELFSILIECANLRSIAKLPDMISNIDSDWYTIHVPTELSLHAISHNLTKATARATNIS